MQLVERGEAALLEGLIPQVPERQRSRLVVAAEQVCCLFQCVCLVLLVHGNLRHATTPGTTVSLAWRDWQGRTGIITGTFGPAQ